MFMSRELSCPLCGELLSMGNSYDGETLTIDFWCEGFGDDEFQFLIKIPLTEEELENFQEGDVIAKKAAIEVIAVKPEEETE